MNVDDYFDDLQAFEGMTTWLYCDVRGFVTVGIGNLVSSPESCMALPFYRKGIDLNATDGEKAAGWRKVKAAYDKTKSAAYYQGVCDLRLELDFVKGLCARRLTMEFIPGIKRLLHDFDDFPLPARKALVDLAYNLGVGGLSKFVTLLDACQRQDWEVAARSCGRKGAREKRNLWTAQMFIDAAAAPPPLLDLPPPVPSPQPLLAVAPPHPVAAALPWYARPDTGLLGLFVRALFWAAKAVSAIFGPSERKKP
jgi:GH24 family phage-related lysozyme (muramidase)